MYLVIFSVFYRIIALFYGSYYSFKILKTNATYNSQEGERLLRFWAVLSFLSIYESYFEWAVSFVIPFYTEIKFGGLVWFLIPNSTAPIYFFNKLLHPSIKFFQTVLVRNILPVITNTIIRTVSIVQPHVIQGLTSYLNKEELLAWERSLRCEVSTIAMELEKRRLHYNLPILTNKGTSTSSDNNKATEVSLPLRALTYQEQEDIVLLSNRPQNINAVALLQESEQIKEQLLRDGTNNSPISSLRLRRFVKSMQDTSNNNNNNSNQNISLDINDDVSKSSSILQRSSTAPPVTSSSSLEGGSSSSSSSSNELLFDDILVPSTEKFSMIGGSNNDSFRIISTTSTTNVSMRRKGGTVRNSNQQSASSTSSNRLINHREGISPSSSPTISNNDINPSLSVPSPDTSNSSRSVIAASIDTPNTTAGTNTIIRPEEEVWI